MEFLKNLLKSIAHNESTTIVPLLSVNSVDNQNNRPINNSYQLMYNKDRDVLVYRDTQQIKSLNTDEELQQIIHELKRSVYHIKLKDSNLEFLKHIGV